MDKLQNILSVLTIVVALGIAGCSSGTPPTVLLDLPEAAGEPVTLRIRLPESDETIDWSELLAVYVDQTTDSSPIGPVQGTCRVVDDTLTFHPDFPFSPGVRYRVEVAADLAATEHLRGVHVSRLGREFVGVHFALPEGYAKLFEIAEALDDQE